MISQRQTIIDILKEFDTDKLLNLWNKYCSEEKPEDYIYYNDEYTINEMFNGNPYEAIRATQYGEYSFTDEYFIVNAYNNLTSFDNSDIASHIGFGTLADYIMENGCDEINEAWYEDMQYEFLRYFNEKYGTTLDAEDYERIPEDADLITDDWDEIAEEHYDEISR